MNTKLDLSRKRVLVAGADGFLGHHVIAELRKREPREIIGVDKTDFDLREQEAVRQLLSDVQPQVVINLAGLVGGILVNTQRPAEFFFDNLMMGTLLLHESWRAGADKYLACLCGCAYPGNAPSPIKEEMLWDGYPQINSAPYGTAKKVVPVQSGAYREQYGFRSIVLVPGNVYGPHENFNLNDAHVIPSLIRKFFEAKRDKQPLVTVWGTGAPVRDFVYAGDAAEAIVLALEEYDGTDIINISSGTRTSIRDLVELVAELTGYGGEIVWDSSKPDGQAVKIFDNTRMREILGYECGTSLREGIEKTIQWLQENYGRGTVRL